MLDIAAATQTLPAHKAALSTLKFNGSSIELPERYLISLSLATHPSVAVVRGQLYHSPRSTGFEVHYGSENLEVKVVSKYLGAVLAKCRSLDGENSVVKAGHHMGIK